MNHFVACRSYSTARRHHPSAVRVCRVYGGFACFETWTDYLIWRNQK